MMYLKRKFHDQTPRGPIFRAAYHSSISRFAARDSQREKMPPRYTKQTRPRLSLGGVFAALLLTVTSSNAFANSSLGVSVGSDYARNARAAILSFARSELSNPQKLVSAYSSKDPQCLRLKQMLEEGKFSVIPPTESAPTAARLPSWGKIIEGCPTLHLDMILMNGRTPAFAARSFRLYKLHENKDQYIFFAKNFGIVGQENFTYGLYRMFSESSCHILDTKSIEKPTSPSTDPFRSVHDVVLIDDNLFLIDIHSNKAINESSIGYFAQIRRFSDIPANRTSCRFVVQSSGDTK